MGNIETTILRVCGSALKKKKYGLTVVVCLFTRFLHSSNITLPDLDTLIHLTKEEDKLSTKLRHVDIKQNWLRQEVQAGRITVEWAPTAAMPADGLTKILPKQKFAEFIRQIGLVDITKRLKDINQTRMDDFDTLHLTTV